MRTLNVDLGSRAYPIIIGPDIIETGFEGVAEWTGRAAIVSNEVVGPLYLKSVRAALERTGIHCDTLILRDGEATKTWESLNAIHDHLLAERHDRKSILLALGGGVVGDLTGFAAATYQRGINFIQVPTTLLAQVDSSVGGKTGINHARGKNMIGAFWQPRLVLADTRTLRTLPDREFSAGLAEVIKYGLLGDPPFLEWLEKNIDGLMRRDDDLLAYAIERSCADKAAIVAADELETATEGGRALLNLGHTFGHAIETGAGYGVWLHGEAVAAGMVMAAELSRRLGWLATGDVERVRALLRRAGLPIKGEPLGAQRYLDLMGHDKKVLAGRLRLVLLKRLGEAVTHGETPRALIAESIESCCA